MSTGHVGTHEENIVSLKNIGISSENIGFANVTMMSENFACVRENKTSDKSSLRIIDMRQAVEISEKPITAESAIMNPIKPDLALRSGNTLQVFNIETKAKITSIQHPCDVIFWTWIDGDTLGLVSDKSIYLWKYCDEPSPIISCEKSAALDGTQIINMSVDSSGNWITISGIALKDNRICGTVQLYSREKQLSQIVEAHVGCFIRLKSLTSPRIYNIFAFASRNNNDVKIQLVEVDPDSEDSFHKQVVDLPVGAMPENDFPIGMVFDAPSSLLFAYTKFGFRYVIEPYTGTCFFQEKLSDSPLYLVVPATDCSSHFVLDRSGQINRLSVNQNEMFSRCVDLGPEYYFAAGYMLRCLSFAQQGSCYRQEFDRLKNSERFVEALLLLTKSEKPFLRSFEFLSSVKDFPAVNGTAALLEYFAMVLEAGSLNEVESLELAQLAVKKSKLEILKKWLQEEKIYCTKQLGDLVFDSDIALSLEIYQKCESDGKSLLCLILLDRFEEFNAVLEKSSDEVSFSQLLADLNMKKPESTMNLVSFAFEKGQRFLSREFIEYLLSSDFNSHSGEIDGILAKNSKLLFKLDSKEINSKVLTRLISGNPALVQEFVGNAEKPFQFDSLAILPQLEELGLFLPAFILADSTDEAFKFAELVQDFEAEIPFVSISSDKVKDLLSLLMEKNSTKYLNLCITLGKLVPPKYFGEVDAIFEGKICDEKYRDFLSHWLHRAPSSDLQEKLFTLAIRLDDTDSLIPLCRDSKIQDPKSAFKKISQHDYRCEAVSVLAKMHNLHVDALTLYYKKSDLERFKEYANSIPPDSLWSALPELVDSEIPEEYLTSIVALPENLDLFPSVAKELEIRDKLTLLRPLLNKSVLNNESANLLKAKLAIFDDDVFLEMMNNPKDINQKEVMDYCEEKNPALAFKLYLQQKKIDDIFRMASVVQAWDRLVFFLIEAKSQDLWRRAISSKYSDEIVGAICLNPAKFTENQELTALIKVFAAEGRSDELIKVTTSILLGNIEFSSNRALQTLHLITIIRNQPKAAFKFVEELNNYNGEDVVREAMNTGSFEIAFKVLQKFESWNNAFKIALYHLKDEQLAHDLAAKSGHPEAWHALADYHLAKGDADRAVEFALKCGQYRREKDLVILLYLKENYALLLKYLDELKALGKYSSSYDREVCYCLLKLNNDDGLLKLVESSSQTMASELGKILFRGGKINLARRCFEKAKSFEWATVCYLKMEDLNLAAEFSLKSDNHGIWRKVLIAALKKGESEISLKFGLKCLALSSAFEEILALFEKFGAKKNLVNVLDTYLISSTPTNPQIASLIGLKLCQFGRDKLDGFIQKCHAILPKSFKSTLIEHHFWLECFKFALFKGDLELAIEMLTSHPTITIDYKKMTSAMLNRVEAQTSFEKLLSFFSNYHPDELIEILPSLLEKVNLSLILKYCSDHDCLFILDSFLRRQLDQNAVSANPVTSGALNELLISVNDYYGLIESIRKCPSAAASGNITEKLRKSGHRHFRTLAAKLMANSGLYADALKILLTEDALIEAMLVLGQSNNTRYAEVTFARYAHNRNKLMFLVTGYVLFDLIRPDVLVELSQTPQFNELSLALICQTIRQKVK